MSDHICTCGDCNPGPYIDKCKYAIELYNIYYTLHLMMEPDGRTARECIVALMARVGEEPPERDISGQLTAAFEEVYADWMERIGDAHDAWWVPDLVAAVMKVLNARGSAG